MSKSFTRTPTLSAVSQTSLKQTLGQIASEAMQLAQVLAANGGEITPELEVRLEVNAQSLMNKVDAYASIEEQFLTQAELFKRKADAITAISRSYKNEVEKLRSRIKFVMKELDKTEVKGNEHRYVLSRSAPKLVIDDKSLIPSEFQMVVQETVIDNEKLKQALMNGFEVPGAHVEENGTLRIYENTGKE